MLDIKKLIKKALVSACVIFTVITAVYMLILQIQNVSKVSAAVESGRVLLFFVFSVLLATANSILSITSIDIVIRYMIHYIICAIGFGLCFCLPNGMPISTMFVGIIFFSICYSIIMPIVAFFKRRLKRNKAIQEKISQQAQIKGQANAKKQSRKKKR